MNEDDKRLLVTGGCLSHVIIFIVGFLLAVLLLGSCTTTEYVTVPEVHTDTLMVTQHSRDSIYVHDSTFVEVKGDTTLIERWHTAWRERIAHDTSFVVRVDSVPMPYPVEKKIEKQLSWWQKTQMYAGDVLLVLLAGGIAYGIFKIKDRLL